MRRHLRNGRTAFLGTDLYESILSYFRQVLQYEAFQIVTGTLDQVRAGAGGGKLTFGMVVTLSGRRAECPR